MTLKNQIVLALVVLSSLLLLACSPEPIIVEATIVKYQCHNGQIVDSEDMCDTYECPVCPSITCVSVNQPYIESIPYNYTFKYGVISDETTGELEDLFGGLLTANYVTQQVTKIKNFDEKAGKFIVYHSYRTLKNETTNSIAHTLTKDETKEFITTFDTDFGEDVEVKTEIRPPTEIREKEVIRYREVDNCHYDADNS